MIKISNKYEQEVHLDKDEIFSLINQSNDFVTEDTPSYGGQLYTSSRLNKVMIRKSSDNEIELSENAGLGGLLEVIGILTINKIDIKTSKLSIKFKMGVFPIVLPYYFFIIFGILGFIMIFVEFALSMTLIGLSLFSLMLMFVKRYRVEFFLSHIENTLNISKNWEIK